MKRFFKSFMYGICLSILYIEVVLGSTLALLLMGYSEVDSNPKILGFPLYSIRINGATFHSEATTLGVLLSLSAGMILYYVVSRKRRITPKM